MRLSLLCCSRGRSNLGQIISAEAYDPVMVDIWSAGITLYAMLCGNLPFDDESKSILYDNILACHYHIPSYVSPLAANLLKKILVRKVSDRLTIEEIRQHPWFKMHQPILFSEGYFFSNTSNPVPVEKPLAKLAAFMLEVNVESISKMVSDNEHNKYTIL